MQNNNLILGIVIALIVGGAIGYAAAGYQYSGKLEKAREAFPSQSMMQTVSGTIQSISGNTITIQTSPSINPFEDLPTMRTVTVTSETKIIKSEPKDPAVFQKEMEAYQKATSVSAPKPGELAPAGADLPTPPQPFTETALSLSDLTVGDMVIVDAGKDVKTAASFEAVKITLGGTATALAPVGGTVPTGTNQGTAPMVNTPQVKADGGTPPIVNTPPVKK